MQPTISVIIPVHNAALCLDRCLQAIARSRLEAHECIVSDDASTDESAAIAEIHRFKVLRQTRRRGPAAARNAGAAVATGDLLLFLDADVLVERDLLEKVTSVFVNNPNLDALIGSYDDAPEATNFVSQYRNLLHHYVHQVGRDSASTFWGACGAIRRTVFLSHGGFDENFARPCVEDIDLGTRMAMSSRRILLARDIQVKHLKRWNLWTLIRTDLFDRAIPWARLILRYRFCANDLSLRTSQWFSVLLTWTAALTLICSTILFPRSLFVLSAAGALVGTLLLNRHFYLFLKRCRGWLFAVRAMPLHVLYFFYSGLAVMLAVAGHLWEPHAVTTIDRSITPIKPSRIKTGVLNND